MELMLRLTCFFFCLGMISSASVLEINIPVDGNYTMREPVTSVVSLQRNGQIIAAVIYDFLVIYDHHFDNILQWNKSTKFMTLVHLDMVDSGMYQILDIGDSLSAEHDFFNITVFAHPPFPHIKRSRKDYPLCILRCYVNYAPPLTSVVWMKDQEVVISSNGSDYVWLTISEQDLKSSFTCEIQGPAENDILEVDVIRMCANISHRLLLIFLTVPVGIVFALHCWCVYFGRRYEWKIRERKLARIREVVMAGNDCY